MVCARMPQPTFLLPGTTGNLEGLYLGAEDASVTAAPAGAGLTLQLYNRAIVSPGIRTTGAQRHNAALWVRS